MSDFLAALSEQAGPAVVDRGLTLALGVAGVGLTYLSLRLLAWAGRGAGRGAKVAWGALANRARKPEPCEVAREILLCLEDPSAITDGADLVTSSLLVKGAGTGLGHVMSGGTDLLDLLSTRDRNLVRGEAWRRHREVAEAERKSEHERVATALRRERLTRGSTLPAHDCRGTPKTSGA